MSVKSGVDFVTLQIGYLAEKDKKAKKDNKDK